MDLFGWWSDQSPWVRYGVALIFLAIAVVAFLGGGRRGGALAGAIGLGMLFFAGPSDSEKKGYRF